MAELKTKPTNQSVDAFLSQVADEHRRQDCYTVLELMQQATGAAPTMWGDAIVGFGQTHLRYASGRELDWFLTGFSPRKQNLTLYLSGGLANHEDVLQRLGKHKTGKGCLYINRLGDIDLSALRELIARSVQTQP
jgi:hypothetical protein